MFRVDSIAGNTQRLDGGSMFGNCPRALWRKWTTADELHRIPLACRAMLVRDGQRMVLFETGIGAFFEPKLRSRFGVNEAEHVLLDSLGAVGLSHEQIDVVVLSHLHFDHAGGLLSQWQAEQRFELLFPKATYLASRRNWQRARAPHHRDRASFIPELLELLNQSGRLELIDDESAVLPADRYSFSFSDGHTPGLMVSHVQTPRGPIHFVGDLIPGIPWIHLPITMGYDRYPELLIDEKKTLLERVVDEQGWVFLTHDPDTAACQVRRNDKGRYEAVQAQGVIQWRDDSTTEDGTQ